MTALLNPAFTDLNLRGRTRFRLELDHEGVPSDVIPDATAGIISRAQNHTRLFASADGSLSIEVEFTQRFNFVAVEFNPQRQGSLPGKNIDNTAADRELTPGRNLGDAFVTGT